MSIVVDWVLAWPRAMSSECDRLWYVVGVTSIVCGGCSRVCKIDEFSVSVKNDLLCR